MIDLTKCKPGDVLVCRDGRRMTYQGPNGGRIFPHHAHYRTDDSVAFYSFTTAGEWDPNAPHPLDIIAIEPTPVTDQHARMLAIVDEIRALAETVRKDRDALRAERDELRKRVDELQASAERNAVADFKTRSTFAAERLTLLKLTEENEQLKRDVKALEGVRDRLVTERDQSVASFNKVAVELGTAVAQRDESRADRDALAEGVRAYRHLRGPSVTIAEWGKHIAAVAAWERKHGHRAERPQGGETT